MRLRAHACVQVCRCLPFVSGMKHKSKKIDALSHPCMGVTYMLACKQSLHKLACCGMSTHIHTSMSLQQPNPHSLSHALWCRCDESAHQLTL